jgi:hypothetical protein
MLNIEINMKYSKNRHYRDQEIIIEKEIVTLSKKLKKNKKETFLNKFGKKILSWFKK